MNAGGMKRQNTTTSKGLKDAFQNAACSSDDGHFEFIRLLARIAAEEDYKALLKKSNAAYNDPPKKGQ